MGSVLLTMLNYRRAGKNKAPQLRGFEGGTSWGRTSDTRIFSPLLYQLSYGTSFEGCKCKNISISAYIDFYQIDWLLLHLDEFGN
jgi:hypothetical protein